MITQSFPNAVCEEKWTICMVTFPNFEPALECVAQWGTHNRDNPFPTAFARDANHVITEID
ncbi:hypothetical protein AW736_02455 [Termitidicoccus mucosus]|uniref:Uncharacterized protein n=1 Tax=Termitidicoccus mucosus TaxID=1184151 RepID=A0A178INW5_9BACT|nr:hypothetical protein AW736_02455 [Opitutaceae bacterium TSB47]